MKLLLSLWMSAPREQGGEPILEIGPGSDKSDSDTFHSESLHKTVEELYVIEAMAQNPDYRHELKDLANQAFELGRRYERGELNSGKPKRRKKK